MKKIMTVLLALVMALALLPATIWAAGETDEAAAKIGTTEYATLDEAVKAANTGDTVVLQKNIDVTAQVVVDAKDITLDMNGKTINYTGESLSSGVLMVRRGAGLTVTGNGTIQSGEAMVAIAVTQKGDDATKIAKLTVQNGTFVGKDYTISGNGMRNGTDITINGGKFESKNGTAIYHPQDGKLVINNGVFTGKETAIEIRSGEMVINGGSFKSTTSPVEVKPNGNGTTTQGVAIAVAQHTTKQAIKVTINGGTFIGVNAFRQENPQNNEAEFVNKISASIKGGSFHGAVYSENLTGFITGGTFNTNPLADYSNFIDSAKEYNIAIESVAGGYLYTMTEKTEAKEPAEVKVVGGTFGEEGKPSTVEAEVPVEDVSRDKNLTVTDGDKTSVTFNEEAVKSFVDKEVVRGNSLKLEVKTHAEAIDESNKTAFDKAVEGKKEGTALVVSLNLLKVTPNGSEKVFTEEKAGATATVTVPYTLKDGETLVVYYLNGDKLEKLDDKNVTVNKEDGTVTLTLVHFSEYVLTTVAASGTPAGDPDDKPIVKPGDKPTEGKGDAPKTFDAGIAAYGVTAILSVTGMAWMGLKKRK